jgi:hypothetical protein
VHVNLKKTGPSSSGCRTYEIRVSEVPWRLPVFEVVHYLRYKVITLSDQYHWLLLVAFAKRIWAGAEWATFFTVSAPAGSDGRYWSGKIMSSCIYTRRCGN